MIVLVASGMNSPKKGDFGFLYKHKYLNYGALAVASAFVEDALVLHGGFDSPLVFAQKHHAELKEATLVGVSIPSFLSLQWAIEFCGYLSRITTARFLIGGRWVVDGNVSLLKEFFPQNAVLVEGLAEAKIAAVVKTELGRRLCTSGFDGLSNLNYERLGGSKDFSPSFEVSRGCGMRCSFCVESDVPLSRLKRSERLIEEIQSNLSHIDASRMFYLQASFFAANLGWAKKLVEAQRLHGLYFRWRTETRVDALPLNTLGILAESGLAILDLGIESASHAQLRSMMKTSDPVRYLQKASSLLRECHQLGVLCKLNILLYPGETPDSIAETIDWLQQHREYISGVSVYPTILYGLGNAANALRTHYVNDGAVGFKESCLGMEQIDLSKSIDIGSARDHCLRISREFMTDQQYFLLKSATYFPADYTARGFCTEVLATCEQQLPFRVTDWSSAYKGGAEPKDRGVEALLSPS